MTKVLESMSRDPIMRAMTDMPIFKDWRWFHVGDHTYLQVIGDRVDLSHLENVYAFFVDDVHVTWRSTPSVGLYLGFKILDPNSYASTPE